MGCCCLYFVTSELHAHRSHLQLACAIVRSVCLCLCGRSIAAYGCGAHKQLTVSSSPHCEQTERVARFLQYDVQEARVCVAAHKCVVRSHTPSPLVYEQTRTLFQTVRVAPPRAVPAIDDADGASAMVPLLACCAAAPLHGHIFCA